MTLISLRKTLALDALSCAAVFAACVPFAGAVARTLGLPQPVVAAGGWICLVAGLVFAALALMPQPSRMLVALGAFGNALWIAASLAVVAMFAAQMSAIGIVVVLGQAAAVGMLTWLEASGVRSLRPAVTTA